MPKWGICLVYVKKIPKYFTHLSLTFENKGINPPLTITIPFFSEPLMHYHPNQQKPAYQFDSIKLQKSLQDREVCMVRLFQKDTKHKNLIEMNMVGQYVNETITQATWKINT